MAKRSNVVWNNKGNLPVPVSSKSEQVLKEKPQSTPSNDVKFFRTAGKIKPSGLNSAGKNGGFFEHSALSGKTANGSFSRSSFKVVINKVERPFSSNWNNELDWICNSLGFETEGKDSSANSIFKEIVSASEQGKPHTSTSLAKKMAISRGSVINHLNNLLRAGMVSRNGRFYLPRSKSMFRTINEIEEDIERVFNKMKEAAKRIDKKFGIETEE